MAYNKITIAGQAPNSNGEINISPNFSILTLTDDYIITTTSGIREVFALTSSANRVITLPNTSTVGEGYQYDIKSLSNVTFTITCASNNTIDDGSSTTFDLTDQYSSITLVSDGTSQWYIV